MYKVNILEPYESLCEEQAILKQLFAESLLICVCIHSNMVCQNAIFDDVPYFNVQSQN